MFALFLRQITGSFLVAALDAPATEKGLRVLFVTGLSQLFRFGEVHVARKQRLSVDDDQLSTAYVAQIEALIEQLFIVMLTGFGDGFPVQPSDLALGGPLTFLWPPKRTDTGE